MNWYAAKLLADEFAADRQRTAGTHRRVGANPAQVGSPRRTVQAVVDAPATPAGSGERLRTHKTLSGATGDDRQRWTAAARLAAERARLTGWWNR